MPNLKRILLLIGDIVVLYLSLLLTLLIRYGSDFNYAIWTQHLWPFTFVFWLWLVIFYIAGLYELTLARNNLIFFTTLLKALGINIALAVAFFYFIPFFGITPKTNLFITLGIFIVLFLLWRQSYNYLVKSIIQINNILFVGDNKEINLLKETIDEHPQLGYRVAFQIEPKDITTPFDLLEIVTQKNIKSIVTAMDPYLDKKLVQGLYQCLPLKTSFYDLPSFHEKILGKVPISSIGEIWFLENLTESQKNFYEASKRIFDMLGSFIFGLISLVMYPLIALTIKLDSPGPVFYKQRRIGLDGQAFTVIKFRTMIEEAEKEGVKWADHQDYRITKLGKLMRKIRLDELPQLWNIFVGQMSFIGPRPERVEFVQQLEKEIPYYQVRHIIRPGLTGWAQVSFRYGASVKDSVEKLQYELYYIKHRSVILDISIILKTINIILKRSGR